MCSRTSRQHSFNEQVPEKEPSHVKLGVVARLRMEVYRCTTNKALAAMVSDFAKVTNKSTGRTITKVGSPPPWSKGMVFNLRY
jgi:casein kinase 1